MIVVDKPKFRMAIYEAKKEVHVQILGFVREELVPEYVSDLQATIARVNNQQAYTFVVDATYQSPLPAKVATDLGQTMLVYTTFGFPKIKIILPKSKISYVQVRNAILEVDFPGELYFQDGTLFTKEEMYRKG